MYIIQMCTQRGEYAHAYSWPKMLWLLACQQLDKLRQLLGHYGGLRTHKLGDHHFGLLFYFHTLFVELAQGQWHGRIQLGVVLIEVGHKSLTVRLLSIVGHSYREHIHQLLLWYQSADANREYCYKRCVPIMNTHNIDGFWLKTCFYQSAVEDAKVKLKLRRIEGDG